MHILSKLAAMNIKTALEVYLCTTVHILPHNSELSISLDDQVHVAR